MNSLLKKMLSGLIIINFLLATSHAEERVVSVSLQQGQPAPFSGVLLTNEKANETRVKLIENESLSKSIEFYKKNEMIKVEQIYPLKQLQNFSTKITLIFILITIVLYHIYRTLRTKSSTDLITMELYRLMQDYNVKKANGFATHVGCHQILEKPRILIIRAHLAKSFCPTRIVRCAVYMRE